MKISCRCGASHPDELRKGMNTGEIQTITGFHSAMNQKRGLEIVWVCPPCWARCQDAIKILAEVFGEDAQYIFFGNFFK